MFLMCVVGTKEGLARGKLLYFVAVVRVVVVVDFVVEVASKFAESDDICVVSVWSTRATTERHIFLSLKDRLWVRQQEVGLRACGKSVTGS